MDVQLLGCELTGVPTLDIHLEVGQGADGIEGSQQQHQPTRFYPGFGYLIDFIQGSGIFLFFPLSDPH